jgi:hypothetical protein
MTLDKPKPWRTVAILGNAGERLGRITALVTSEKAVSQTGLVMMKPA